MGNHCAGKAMGLAAHLVLPRRRADDQALALLDAICGPFRGCDAEFEAEDLDDPDAQHLEFNDYRDPHPNAALGMLMVEAFAPNGLLDLGRYAPALHGDDDAYDRWADEVETPFRERYDFN